MIRFQGLDINTVGVFPSLHYIKTAKPGEVSSNHGTWESKDVAALSKKLEKGQFATEDEAVKAAQAALKQAPKSFPAALRDELVKKLPKASFATYGYKKFEADLMAKATLICAGDGKFDSYIPDGQRAPQRIPDGGLSLMSARGPVKLPENWTDTPFDKNADTIETMLTVMG